MSRFSFDHVKFKYGVPVKRGQRVTTEDGREGVVTCGQGPYVRVRLAGERRSRPHHPLSLDYGDGITIAQRLDWHNARIETWNDRLNGRITDEQYRDRMNVPLIAVPA